MSKIVIIVSADSEDGILKLSAPLDTPEDRKIVIELLQGAIGAAKNYKGAGILIANNALVTEMSPEKINHQTNIKL
jgi:hypothetical protein